ncbi:hypothetical protein G6L37_00905 [Agrobacterium rubi]|nr:hypothetical protein [Agrobacterium rubi]NTF23950.1 hypothetical protein [Agrobacterium rubi]
MTKLTDFFKTPDGHATARTVTKVFSGAAVVAAMSAALPAPSANALPISAAMRNSPHPVPVVNYQDVMAFETRLLPLKEQKEAYETMILAYGELLEMMRELTMDPSEVTPREQMAIYGALVTGWIELSRANLAEAAQEELEAVVVDASAKSLRHGSDARPFEEAYRKVASRNVELREAIERMTANLSVIVVYGDAEVDDVQEAFRSYRNFETELVDLKIAEPSDATSDELVSSPRP